MFLFSKEQIPDTILLSVIIENYEEEHDSLKKKIITRKNIIKNFFMKWVK